MENEIFTGVLGDPRLDPRVVNGHSVNEILAESAVLNWQKKTPVQYPVWNQAGTSACVAFSKAKQLSIKIFNLTGVWIDFSPASIYQLRANKPQGGMNIGDANQIVNERGATLEALMKSQNLSEEQIMAVKRTKVADLFAKAIAEAVVSYLYVPVDIDRIAQTIESGKAVSLLIFATSDEYSRLRPVVLNPGLIYEQAPIRHEIVAVDYFIDQDGTKVIHCNDSSHFGGIPLRNLTADFITKRCILADAIDMFTFEPGEVQKPHYDESVKSLQDCLKHYGTFPANVDSTGYMGNITWKAVRDFQVKEGLHPTGVNNVGVKTKARLHELYP